MASGLMARYDSERRAGLGRGGGREWVRRGGRERAGGVFGSGLVSVTGAGGSSGGAGGRVEGEEGEEEDLGLSSEVGRGGWRASHQRRTHCGVG